METNRWQKLEKIYHSALEKPADSQREFIEKACADDKGLRDEILAMISTNEYSVEFLNEPVVDLVWQSLLDKSDAQTEKLSSFVGTTLGHFHILRVLGFGGMGEVYLAQDTILKRQIALKLLSENLSENLTRVERFKKEAQAVALISHPNVAQVYEVGEINGRFFIALEYVEGETLREHLTRNGNIAWQLAQKISQQIAEVLQFAHQKGVTHRDIKPENIMLSTDGIVKILDFGLARLTEKLPILEDSQTNPAANTTHLLSTEPGMIMGTVNYMSPEQARGIETNSQTDIWSFGVVFYEMLTGQPPFKGQTSLDTLFRIISTPFEPINQKGIPKDVNRILKKCLSKKTAGRIQNGIELLTELQNIKADRSVLLTSTNLLIFLVLIVLPVIGLTAYFWNSQKTNTVEPITVKNFLEKGGISWWQADGNALDSFGNNHGKMINGATFDEGIFGQGFKFDGKDDYIETPTQDFPIHNSPRTIEFWFKVNSFDKLEETFFVGYGDFSDKHGLTCHFGVVGSEDIFFSSWEPGIGNKIPLETNRWYHVAGTMNEDKKAQLYLDGKEISSNDIFFDTPANTSFYIGRIGNRYGEIRKLDGMIDEVRVFNRVLTPEEIAANATVKSF